jgi:hypothetical protein
MGGYLRTICRTMMSLPFVNGWLCGGEHGPHGSGELSEVFRNRSVSGRRSRFQDLGVGGVDGSEFSVDVEEFVPEASTLGGVCVPLLGEVPDVLGDTADLVSGDGSGELAGEVLGPLLGVETELALIGKGESEVSKLGVFVVVSHGVSSGVSLGAGALRAAVARARRADVSRAIQWSTTRRVAASRATCLRPQASENHRRGRPLETWAGRRAPHGQRPTLVGWPMASASAVSRETMDSSSATSEARASAPNLETTWAE